LSIDLNQNQQLKLKLVVVESDDQKKDSFDSLLGYIWINDILINEQLIKEGKS
jgi:endonuclease YncB( thermonuclease family)